MTLTNGGSGGGSYGGGGGYGGPDVQLSNKKKGCLKGYIWDEILPNCVWIFFVNYYMDPYLNYKPTSIKESKRFLFRGSVKIDEAWGRVKMSSIYLMIQKSLHQVKGSLSHYLQGNFIHPNGGCLGFPNYQQYGSSVIRSPGFCTPYIYSMRGCDLDNATCCES